MSIKMVIGGGGGGGGGGTVQSVTGVAPISVDNSDPANPIISYADLHVLATFTKNVASVQEFGVTVDNVNFAWTYNRNADNPTSQTINQGIGVLPVADRAYALVGGGIVTDTTFTISAVGDDGTASSLNTSFDFVYPYYYGVGAPGLTPVQIAALTKLVAVQSNKVLPFAPVWQVYYFAYPDSYPQLTQISDANGFAMYAVPGNTAGWTTYGTGAIFDHPAISITGLDGTPQDYKVYEYNNPTPIVQNLTFTY